jgi:hypothetical protein
MSEQKQAQRTGRLIQFSQKIVCQRPALFKYRHRINPTEVNQGLTEVEKYCLNSLFFCQNCPVSLNFLNDIRYLYHNIPQSTIASLPIITGILT